MVLHIVFLALTILIGLVIPELFLFFFFFLCASRQQLKLVMDSVIWAFRHTERNIAETGLNLLLELLKKFQVFENSLSHF